jgi:hypothetical protein
MFEGLTRNSSEKRAGSHAGIRNDQGEYTEACWRNT